MSRKIKDMNGKRFGKLLVTSFVEVRGGYAYWNCKCDCGNKKTINEHSLRRGLTKSCGCLMGKGRTLPYGEASLRDLFRSYESHGKQISLPFELSKEEFKVLTRQNCFYCGIEPFQIWHPQGTNGEYLYNGIDRIDNNIGYIIENSVTSCHKCNQAKRAMKEEEFYEWVSRLYKNLKTKGVYDQ